MTEQKEQYINVCFLGHVDSGKSTTIGHLCYKLGVIDKRTLDKLEEVAKEHGKGSFSYAFFCDNNKAERESGITIQVSMKVVKTAKHTVNILDCPGHRGFLKNMITGTAQADVAVIIVPAAQGEFERAIADTSTLYEHIVLAHTLGVSKAIVAINKLDTLGSDAEAKARFEEISENIKGRMKKMYNMKTTPIIAISGFKGYGLTAEGEKFDWFKGWTPEETPDATPIRSLEEAIDYYPIPKRMTEAPLRIPLTNILEIKGIGRVYTGRVESGTCLAGMKVNIAPAGVATEVKTMEIHKTARKKVEAGENCGITLKTNQDTDKIKQGAVIADAANPCIKGFAAYATVIFIGKVKCIKAGYAPTMDIAATHVSTIFAKLCDIGSKKGKEFVVTNDKPTEISGTRPCARVIIVPSKPTVMEKFSEFPFLGRFALRDMGKTIGVGIIHEVLDKAATEARVPEYFATGKKTAKK
ncbi:elongation factor 1-alpha [Nematocida sp. ERTm5]|nr:elongation factor 1-alpha [Nematocida sp. AWRm79]KAI5183971.1 elongation factor 1-alpha [Nematocida sp. AWRm78]OAG32232.1 elongation factor 1-alpha [Nematocida sp. ERTm5]